MRCRAAETKTEKLNEGLGDILQILCQKYPRSESDKTYADEKNSDQSAESGEQLVQQIIAKAFALIRAFESQQLDLQHQLDKAKLALDDTDSIRFDLEIALDEKQILEQETEQLKADLSSLRKRLESEAKDTSLKQLAQIHTYYKAQLQDAAIRAQANLQQLKESHQ